MLQRMQTGWTVQRVVLLAAGAFILATAIAGQQWLAAAIGGFLAAMGLFGYRRGVAGACAGKGCCTPYGDEPSCNLPLDESDEAPAGLKSSASLNY